jgi:antitoxin HicB
MGPILYAYPATLKEDESGRLLVQFPDLPEALTDGANEEEALQEAADCLSEALAARIYDREPIPTPSRATPGQYQISPSLRIGLKAALYSVLNEQKMTVADLARLTKMEHKEARLLLDPKASTKETRLEEALNALGYRQVTAVHQVMDQRRVVGPGGKRGHVGRMAKV